VLQLLHCLLYRAFVTSLPSADSKPSSYLNAAAPNDVTSLANLMFACSSRLSCISHCCGGANLCLIFEECFIVSLIRRGCCCTQITSCFCDRNARQSLPHQSRDSVTELKRVPMFYVDSSMLYYYSECSQAPRLTILQSMLTPII
jgi:hypothetical protein